MSLQYLYTTQWLNGVETLGGDEVIQQALVTYKRDPGKFTSERLCEAWKIALIRDQTPWASRTMRKGSMLLCDLTPNTSRQPTSICTRVFQTPEANSSRKSFSGLFCIAPTILETRCHQDEGETGCTSIPNRKSVGLYFKHSLSRSLGWCYLKQKIYVLLVKKKKLAVCIAKGILMGCWWEINWHNHLRK